ncbi:MAG: ABC transporter permease [Clostridiales Family XIII bacterium]|jgi:osmoprotectant transport system permease protein|nr:ABC transporter permease [Clostridiales Family XIII bacterium]
MLDYLVKYGYKLSAALVEHLRIVGLTLLISIVLASALTLLVMRSPRLSAAVVRLFGGVYAIPSLALFAILVPFTGIGLTTAILVLVLYNQFLLLRNFVAGLAGVDPQIVEAAVGMGMTQAGVLLRIKLPLAFPAILAGIHLSVLSTIGIATIAAAIGAGGIGRILFEGMRTATTVSGVYKIVWGAILAGGLAVAANLLMLSLEKLLAKVFHYTGAAGHPMPDPLSSRNTF